MIKVNTLGIVLGILAGLFLGSVAAAETGVASYYGGRNHGGPTASGERFNQHSHTCAHKHHRFGTRLLVKSGGKSVECRVNDRGPFVRGRIIDLSVAGARSLGIIGSGVARVTVEVIR